MTAPVLEFELPMPPPELSPNARKHWAPKAQAVAAYRYEARVNAASARWLWCNARGEIWPGIPEPVQATVTFVLKTRARRDIDNLLGSLKAGFDGMRDAGVISDDNCWSLQLILKVEYEPRKISHKAPRVRVRLEEAPK